jgi:hypothetical protein
MKLSNMPKSKNVVDLRGTNASPAAGSANKKGKTDRMASPPLPPKKKK